MPNPPPSPHKPPERRPPPLRPRRYIKCPIEDVYSITTEETGETKKYKPCGRSYAHEYIICTENYYEKCGDYNDWEKQEYIKKQRKNFKEFLDENPGLEEILFDKEEDEDEKR